MFKIIGQRCIIPCQLTLSNAIKKRAAATSASKELSHSSNIMRKLNATLYLAPNARSASQ